MPRSTCAEEHDGVPCGRPKSQRSTKWCNWHWLLKQPPSVRDADSLSRAGRKQNPEAAREGDRACNVCAWLVPPFYMGRGRRCVGCEGKAAHERRIITTYDLQLGDYDALFALQRGRCAVCRKEQRYRRLSTDHDHPSDRVRGLLCQQCNDTLGLYGDDTVKALAYFRAFVYYLECHPSSGRWSPPEDQDGFGFPKPAPRNLPFEVSVLGDPTDAAGMRLAPY